VRRGDGKKTSGDRGKKERLQVAKLSAGTDQLGKKVRRGGNTGLANRGDHGENPEDEVFVRHSEGEKNRRTRGVSKNVERGGGREPVGTRIGWWSGCVGDTWKRAKEVKE